MACYNGFESLIASFPSECSDNLNQVQTKWTFEGDKVFADGKHYGNIIERNGNTIKFIVVSDNEFMNGITREITFY